MSNRVALIELRQPNLWLPKSTSLELGWEVYRDFASEPQRSNTLARFALAAHAEFDAAALQDYLTPSIYSDLERWDYLLPTQTDIQNRLTHKALIASSMIHPDEAYGDVSGELTEPFRGREVLEKYYTRYCTTVLGQKKLS